MCVWGGRGRLLRWIEQWYVFERERERESEEFLLWIGRHYVLVFVCEKGGKEENDKEIVALGRTVMCTFTDGVHKHAVSRMHYLIIMHTNILIMHTDKAIKYTQTQTSGQVRHPTKSTWIRIHSSCTQIPP